MTEKAPVEKKMKTSNYSSLDNPQTIIYKQISDHFHFHFHIKAVGHFEFMVNKLKNHVRNAVLTILVQ